jgi:ATP phosphoribosyltransferase
MSELFGVEDLQILRSEGKTEAKVNMGECDAFTDITETGATLKANGNIIVAELFTSNPQLIANPEALKNAAKQEKMEDIRMCIDAVLQAEREPVFMVFMDVPTAVLTEVEKMLPSVVSPTVSPVVDKDWCSVSAVIRESELNILAPKLLRLGVDGIVPIPAPKVFTQDMVKANRF